MSEFRQLTPRVHSILGRAGGIAGENGHDYIGAEHLILAILAESDSIATHAVAKFADVRDIAQEVRRVMATDEYRGAG
jgi:ATP-dependent Clp protease ATP-binding subunit ClpA